ncbi:MAG: A24 family peptidase [Planctomycetota bacterium]|nr:A24 family peptidase [Planctomycetota bacterium]
MSGSQTEHGAEPRAVSDAVTAQDQPPPRAGAGRAWIGYWIVGVSAAAVVASALQIALSMHDQGLFLIVLCYGVLVVGAWLDAATRRIPNVLTYPALLIGVALNLVIAPIFAGLGLDVPLRWLGGPGAGEAAGGLALTAAVGIISFMARGLGGGDVKLLGALGVLIGFTQVMPVLLNTLIIAAIVGVVNWGLRGELIARVQVVALNLMTVAGTRRGITEVYPFQRSEAPFGLSLLLGMVSAHFVQVHDLLLRVALGGGE